MIVDCPRAVIQALHGGADESGFQISLYNYVVERVAGANKRRSSGITTLVERNLSIIVAAEAAQAALAATTTDRRKSAPNPEQCANFM